MNATQIAAIKADIIGKSNFVFNGVSFSDLLTQTRQGLIADYYNQTAFPEVEIWRPDLTISDITNNIVFSDYIALTAAKREAWMALSQGLIINATIPLVRTNFTSIFGNGTSTTNNVIAIAKKKATNLESLFITSGVSELYNYIITAEEIVNILRS